MLNKILKYYNKDYYLHIKKRQIIYLWFLQRIIGFNKDVPFLVTSQNKIQGYKNILFLGDSVKKSLLYSSGIYISVFDNTTLSIGEETILAHNVCIQTANHDLYNLNNYNKKSVKIGRSCWLGNGSIILPGVTIGNNVTVGANAVVTKSFPDNVVIAGVPAKIIKIK